MTRNKAFLVIQALLCALVAGWLAAAAVRLYVEGAAIQASGELFYYIYTREKAAAALQPMLPLIFGALGMTAAGLILGIKDEGGRPANVKYMACAQAVAQDGSRATRTVRIVVLLLAAALIIAGVLNGGLEDVMTKANAICMECVGLG